MAKAAPTKRYMVVEAGEFRLLEYKEALQAAKKDADNIEATMFVVEVVGRVMPKPKPTDEKVLEFKEVWP